MCIHILKEGQFKISAINIITSGAATEQQLHILEVKEIINPQYTYKLRVKWFLVLHKEYKFG